MLHDSSATATKLSCDPAPELAQGKSWGSVDVYGSQEVRSVGNVGEDVNTVLTLPGSYSALQQLPSILP